MELRTGTPEEVGMCPQRIERLRQTAKGWAPSERHSALVVLAARRGVIALHEAYGRQTPAPNAPPVQLDTIFPLASITKPITSTALMMLVDDAQLGLNRPVAEYLPEFQTSSGRPLEEIVLVHHLLTHTSGLRDDVVDRHIFQKIGTTALDGYAREYGSVRDAYLALAYDAPRFCPPGQRHYYCNYGIELVGEIVARVSGQPLAVFAQERIFAPLGMDNTWYVVPQNVRQRVVQRPPTASFAQPDGSGLPEAPIYRRALGGADSTALMDRPWAAAGVYSTALDMARFGQIFLNKGCYGCNRVLSPVAVASMTRNQIPGIGSWFEETQLEREASYGFGWDIRGTKLSSRYESFSSPHCFRHGGAGGVSLWVDPVYEVVACYLSVALHDDQWGERFWDGDLFMNGVIASIIDE